MNSSTTLAKSLQLPGYTLGEILYQGSRTTVYRALATSTQQPVVLKVLSEEYPSFAELVQFRNQYAIARTIQHPGIIELHDLLPHGNGYALVMEDYGGLALNLFCRRQPLSLELVFAIALQLADVLHSLYEHRVIHKDIKPANILIHPETHVVKLIDLAISTQLPKEIQQIQNPNGLEGTLAYMAPEQTGRMNRSVDYRSDYYSLGVTFYELLTGQLPFQSQDPMELIHGHIGVPPVPIRELNPAIPQFLADIVAKLMAKNAEDRYQSALGLKHDLELAQQQVQTATPAAVELGLQDITEHFLIPEKLYGREVEVETLLKTFDQIVGQEMGSASSELMLVGGFSGIGKTSLINEVHKPIVQRRGYFISGKFDQFQRNVPYSAIVSALQKLVQQLLAEGEQQFQRWRHKLQAALGDNAQVIIEVIPEVELLIGPQSPVPELGPAESQLRFNEVFQSFIRVFCAPEHPLVIFLDDLQWADAGTLKLIDLMLSDRTIAPLLLIGAYRDNEVSPDHPLIVLVEQLRRAGATIAEILLQPLSLDHLSSLIAATLHSDHATLAPLVQLIHQKTEGNPFFANEFLKALHQEGFLHFDCETRQWQWDLAQIEARGITDDVVELMVDKLRQLPPATQTAMSLAACVGATFDLSTLAIIAHQSREAVHTSLAAALRAGFVNPISKLDPELLIQSYRFGHDRIQQAAYALIPDQQRQQTHLEIGRSLVQQLNQTEQSDRCFEIADHLNQSVDLITDSPERLSLAQLNLQAAQKAKTSLAYIAALEYVSAGTDLLNADIWAQDAALGLALYRARVDIEYLCGHFDTALSWIDAALAKARTDLEKADIYTQQMVLYVLSGDYVAGVETTYKAFAHLAIEVPLANPEAEAQRLREEINTYLEDHAIDDLMALPRMTDPAKMLAMKLLDELLPATYVAKPELFSWVISKLVVYSIEYGLHPSSFHGFSCYGMLLVFEENYPDAYAFGNIALQLAQAWNEHLQISRTAHVLSAFLMSWVKPVRLSDDIQRLVKADLTYMGYSHAECFGNKLLGGFTIEAMLDEVRVIDHDLAAFENKYTEVINAVFRFSLLALQGTPEEQIRCDGKLWTEADFLAECEAQQWIAGICTHYILRSLTSYLSGDYATAYTCTREAETRIHTRRAGMIVPVFYLTHCLVLAANYGDRPAEQPTILEELHTRLEQLQTWRDHCPDNFDAIYQLVAAEIARLEQQHMVAMTHYDRAIAAARQYGYIHQEAIANECAARFWLSQNKPDFAQLYLVRAYYAYQQWGAIAQVDSLRHCHSDLLQSVLTQDAINLTTEGTIMVTSMASHSSSSSASSSSASMALDKLSIARAAQALSNEIELEALLTQLLKIVIETAGADYCAVLLKPEDELSVAATMQAGQPAQFLEMVPFADSGVVSVSLINLVQHSLQPRIIANAQAHSVLSQDPYIQAQQPQSLFAMPLLKQGKLIGLVYLENKLTTAAFSADRVELITILCTQAAISLENAWLYRQVKQSLHDLQQAQLQIVQSEKMSALGGLVAGVAHEINNPVGCILGNVGATQDYISDLLGLLDRYAEQFPEPGSEIEDELEEMDLDYVREDLPKLIRAMKDSGDRIKSISRSLRTFSRADTETKQTFDLREGIESTVLI